jgi:hypothetical protein
MKYFLLTLGIIAVTAMVGGRAEAQNYPWCAYYSPPGGTNCGFSTFQQCISTVQGIGGMCQPNTQYQPPGQKPTSRKHS